MGYINELNPIAAYASGDQFLVYDADGGTDAEKRISLPEVVLGIGKAGGRTIYGGTSDGDALTIHGSSHANGGPIQLNPTRGVVAVGTSAIDAWNAGWAVLQIGQAAVLYGSQASDIAGMAVNTYYDGTNYKLINTGTATRYIQTSGKHIFQYDAGAAGDSLAWNEGLRVQEDGKVGIGEAAPSFPLHVSDGGAQLLRLERTATLAGTLSFQMVNAPAGSSLDGAFISSSADMIFASNEDFSWVSNNNELLKLSSSGSLTRLGQSAVVHKDSTDTVRVASDRAEEPVSISAADTYYDISNYNRRAQLVLVHGWRASGNYFTDLVMYLSYSNATVIASQSLGTVGARTYVGYGNAWRLRLKIDSGTPYLVQAHMLSAINLESLT